MWSCVTNATLQTLHSKTLVAGLPLEGSIVRAIRIGREQLEQSGLPSLFRDVQNIDEETRRNMTQAFNAVCDRLGLAADDPERGDVASAIIELVAMGERDPARLFSLALEALDG